MISSSLPCRKISLNSICSFEQLSQQLVRSLFLDHRFLSSETIKLYKGASSDTGFAAVFCKKWVAGKWHRSFSSADITLPELYPLVLAIKWFGWYLANHSIIFMTDISRVVENVIKIRSRNQQNLKLVRMLVFACLKYNIVFCCQLLYQGHITQVSFQLVLHMLDMTRICTNVILSESEQQPQPHPKVSKKLK